MQHFLMDSKLAKQPPFVVTLLAACSFFLALSSITLGIIELLQNGLEGVWFVSLGVLLHVVAVWMALVAERTQQSDLRYKLRFHDSINSK
ncbi:hypothetical protein GO755_00685 [Spirosoma sp. HMF4905]|uniref:Uncharacterized protein n=1 Tax=Spirosoma arboris TaxID=2682092 RepID=A0A7K1S3Y2_9BACT|nr:hypothetical protein [Spirosoma arboris]MVM28527.1 hypothetical protein [Spirosoma arboris]